MSVAHKMHQITSDNLKKKTVQNSNLVCPNLNFYLQKQ